MTNSKLNITAALAVALGLSLTLLTAPISAAKKGPRASVSSATTCALSLDVLLPDGTYSDPVLEITTTLTNKSSGNVIAEVRGGEIEGTYKKKDQRGNASRSLGELSIDGLVVLPADVDPELMITAEFPLCNVDGTVVTEVLDARELNGKSTVGYGIKGGEGETRTVMNRCTDDPETLDVNEGGIYVADVIVDIEAACLLLAPPIDP